MIEIKKEKYYKIGVKCGTRQKLIRTIEQWKGDMNWCLRIFFFTFFFLCQNYLPVSTHWSHFSFFFMWQTQSPCTWKFRWSQGGQVPPLAPLWLRHWTKTPINFWWRRRLNSKSLIQPSEILSVELTGTHRWRENWYMIKRTNQTSQTKQHT